jgi:hypothetical protein
MKIINFSEYNFFNNFLITIFLKKLPEIEGVPLGGKMAIQVSGS